MLAFRHTMTKMSTFDLLEGSIPMFPAMYRT